MEGIIKMDTSKLAARMKGYEVIAKGQLIKRMPVAIRIDGKAFHTFTKGFVKPFDFILMNAMQQTTKALCENIQGCVFGYTQSDEITLILIDYQTFETDAWFDNEVQKICSISASMATMYFNKFFKELAYDFMLTTIDEDYILTLMKAIEKGAMFDSRCFNIPKEEVCNLIYWRQLDATRNSIQMVGQANFSHKQLQGKSCNMIQDMLHEQKGINWNNFPPMCKRGTAVIKKNDEWYIDTQMPILKGADREYVNNAILYKED